MRHWAFLYDLILELRRVLIQSPTHFILLICFNFLVLSFNYSNVLSMQKMKFKYYINEG